MTEWCGLLDWRLLLAKCMCGESSHDGAPVGSPSSSTFSTSWSFLMFFSSKSEKPNCMQTSVTVTKSLFQSNGSLTLFQQKRMLSPYITPALVHLFSGLSHKWRQHLVLSPFLCFSMILHLFWLSVFYSTLTLPSRSFTPFSFLLLWFSGSCPLPPPSPPFGHHILLPPLHLLLMAVRWVVCSETQVQSHQRGAGPRSQRYDINVNGHAFLPVPVCLHPPDCQVLPCRWSLATP